jgi:hypothetical protein
MPEIALDNGEVVVNNGEVSCSCCGGSYTLTCESHTGSAQICGWTGYRPDGNTQNNHDPTAPWQYRKWKYVTFTGYGGYYEYWDIDCQNCAGDRRFVLFDATYEITCDEFYVENFSTEYNGPCNNVYGGYWGIVDNYNTYIGHPPDVTTTTLTSKVGNGISQTCTSLVRDYSFASETLSEEVDIAAEIAAQNPTPDATPTCCASTSTINTLPPESTSPLNVGTSTAVKLILTGSGYPPNATLTLTLTYQINGNPNNTETETITIQADANGDVDQEFYIEQPKPGGSRCLTSHTLT